jgi:hypothetical protein
MIGLVITALAVAQPTGDPAAPTLTALNHDEGRSGLYGLGLGIELPLVGLFAARGSGGESGYGYALGAAVSWEVTSRILARLEVTDSRATAAKKNVLYRDGNDRLISSQTADLRDVEFALGGAYLFRDLSRPWAPYVGGQVALHFWRAEYRFNESLESFQTQSEDGTCAPGQPGCRPEAAASVRAGVRLTMARWLQTQAEISLHYVPRDGAPLSNTLLQRDLDSTPQSEWMVRTVFAVRFGV